MRKLIAILIATVMACTFVPLVGAHQDTIVVTLTPSGTVNIDVTPGTWNGAGATIGSTGTSGATDFNLSNIGTVPVDVTIEAIDTTAWELDIATPAHDQFTLAFNVSVAGTWTHFDETPVAFIGDLPVSAEAQNWALFALEVEMPTSTSTNAAQETTITFTGTAA